MKAAEPKGCILRCASVYLSKLNSVRLDAANQISELGVGTALPVERGDEAVPAPSNSRCQVRKQPKTGLANPKNRE